MAAATASWAARHGRRRAIEAACGCSPASTLISRSVLPDSITRALMLALGQSAVAAAIGILVDR
ncbi:hypothetical protein TSH100_04250 [Azospirillum sp. TSH100]|nr:hypothetical protein TSH100_04250 [Azospirillum sp. TSH100]